LDLGLEAVVGDLLQRALPVERLVVAIDPGKVQHRVWLSTDVSGLVAEPLTLPVLRQGLDELTALIDRFAGGQPPLIAIEATGALHRVWTQELARRFPEAVRVFAPSETTAARAQLGSRRFKTDDRDCAALTYLARQGHGRPVLAGDHDGQEALLTAVRFRRGLLAERKAAQQRLHDQVHGLCPGLSAPVGHGRKLDLTTVAGQAVLDCLIDLGGRPAAVRSLQARACGRLRAAEAAYWSQRWKECLPPPADVQVRVTRLARSTARWRQLNEDLAEVEADMTRLLALTDGQVLTTLPGVKDLRAACFSAFTLPIGRFPTAEHLYSATGLAPARYESSSVRKRGGISRQGLPEHRDALMAIAWGLSQHCGPFIDREEQLRARHMSPIQIRVSLARHACRLVFRMLTTQQPFDEQRYRRARHQVRQ
jgi:transposase